MPFNLQLDTDTFIDPNGDRLSYTVTGLPSWLKFEANARKFSGTPPTYGTYSITVTAFDSWSGSANMTFDIVAGIRPNTPPYLNVQI